MTLPLKLKQQIEAILFVASAPVSVKDLTDTTQSTEVDIKTALTQLGEDLSGRGISLLEAGQKFSLVSSPLAGGLIERFLGAEAKTELSKPAIETLAIIAYKQPATRSEIEAVRGVSSEQTIRNLLGRGLIIEERPDPDNPSRRYATSPRFLQYFGYTHAAQIPTLAQLETE